ncbi:hypothetical protein [Serratia ureilytica]|uniref:hypothetical protein n=1 Tax=Serratia ureilytica TaxID=300181 RepID=UPI0018D8FA4C|nr:hypothetical protein [Serratia ureilytica]MBH3016017.1 hypothetical protein [Serratia ureilytica]
MRKFNWVICDCCEGDGKVDNPAFSNGFTSSEWADMDCDEKRSYLDGSYDVPCTNCSGTGKTKVPNIAALSFSEKRELVEQRRQSRFEAECARELEIERRMGC